MNHKFLLLYLNKNRILVTRILNSEKLEDEEVYKTEDRTDTSARKRRDILVHYVSPTDPDNIKYVMTITTAKPKETITGTQTAGSFMESLK